jgi:hypothetical protein
VAKAICLLQYVKSVHRSAENIAAALHGSVGADSQLAEVKDALRGARSGPSGAPRRRRLPHPDARRGRLGAPAQRHQPEARRLAPPLPGGALGFWQPQPSHTLFDTKTFKAGLAIHGRELTSGRHDVPGPPRRGRQGVRRRSPPSCAPAASRSASTSSGPSRSPTRSTARRWSSSAARRCSPQGARDQGRGHARPHRRGARAPAPSQRRAAPLAPAAASRAASTSGATTAAPPTAPSTSARPPPRCSAGAARGLRPLQGGRRQGERT